MIVKRINILKVENYLRIEKNYSMNKFIENKS